LEHRTSVKHFTPLQFLNPKRVGKTPWTGDQPVARPLPIQKHIINTDMHPCIEWDPGARSLVFERAKTVHTLDHAATVMAHSLFAVKKIFYTTYPELLTAPVNKQ
jgi:hypothetical protein